MTPQEHATAIRDALEQIVSQMNEAQAAGVRVDFAFGMENNTGKHVLMKFVALQQMKLDN